MSEINNPQTMASAVHEIYFQTRNTLDEVYTKLQSTFNWPTENQDGSTQRKTHEETGLPYYGVQTLGLEFCLVPNEGPFYIKQYHNYQYYLFLRWNAVDRDTAKHLYTPLLRVLGNLLYRTGYEIEIDSILVQRSREEIKKNDPVMEIEADLESKNLLGL